MYRIYWYNGRLCYSENYDSILDVGTLFDWSIAARIEVNGITIASKDI